MAEIHEKLLADWHSHLHSADFLFFVTAFFQNFRSQRYSLLHSNNLIAALKVDVKHQKEEKIMKAIHNLDLLIDEMNSSALFHLICRLISKFM